jgi:hypothetical protein
MQVNSPAATKASHAALLVAASAIAIVVMSVWVTEPALPRTHLPFAAVVIAHLDGGHLGLTHAVCRAHHAQATVSMARVVCFGGCLRRGCGWGQASVLA